MAKRNWPTLTAFLLILLFVGAADGLMDCLGLAGFLGVGLVVMGAGWVLTEATNG